MRIVILAGAALVVAGCLEPQPAPELTERLSTEFNIETVAEGLSSPWSVAELPESAGGGYLITEKAGYLLDYKDGTFESLSGLFTDIFAEGQGGVLDVVIAPDFEDTKDVYVSYAFGTADANGTALIRGQLDRDRGMLLNSKVVFEASPLKKAASHFAGKIAFLPDDTLLLTIGDGFAYREEAQKADTHLGKIIRLTRDGGVPEDNPFLGQEKDGVAFKPEIYTLGHRNMQGLAIDPVTGDIWEHEHGPRGGDELNLIKPGANYGWPLATTGTDYQGARISPYETFEGTEAPIHDWVPSIAPSGLAIYRGDLFPDWTGDALIGGLASRDLRRVDLENGKVVDEIDLLSDLNGRVRDVRVDSGGAVLVLMESVDLDGDGNMDPDSGQLLRLTPK